jgi:choline dehydrogenase-like flavoprotein
VEFQPVDFAGREWLLGSAWPVKYEEIAPFYRETYDNFGIEGDAQNDDAVWKSISSERPHLGDEFEAFFTRWLQIPSFAILYAKQYKTSEMFSVLLGHTVVGFEGSGKRITGVRVVDAAGAPHTIAGKTFILAAGTIENARLLLHAAADESWACPWRKAAFAWIAA